MKLTKTRAILLASLALPIGLATAAIAQDHAAGPPGHGEHGDMMYMRHDDPADQARRAERHAQHLRDALQLRPDQEPALQALIASMKPPEGMAEHMRAGREEDERLTTPQRLDRMLAHLDEMRAHMAAHAEAVKRFYAQLTPAQQKAFDEIGPGMHRHMMMRMGGPGHMGGMGGGGERHMMIMRHGDDDGPEPPPPPPRP
ncbi:MAG TPA: Spy/CpxP family protein refolding chaperone [Caulobacteraceae bacterium]|nr:Spy/CpxP family protein refolding chaperone [Caulobacteraceae bacterium]